jgi:hypothetical protein
MQEISTEITNKNFKKTARYERMTLTHNDKKVDRGEISAPRRVASSTTLTEVYIGRCGSVDAVRVASSSEISQVHDQTKVFRKMELDHPDQVFNSNISELKSSISELIGIPIVGRKVFPAPPPNGQGGNPGRAITCFLSTDVNVPEVGFAPDYWQFGLGTVYLAWGR